jgi:hypothetical protein
LYNQLRFCRCDGIGRRAGFKIQWWQHRIGSTPITGTKQQRSGRFSFRFFVVCTCLHLFHGGIFALSKYLLTLLAAPQTVPAFETLPLPAFSPSGVSYARVRNQPPGSARPGSPACFPVSDKTGLLKFSEDLANPRCLCRKKRLTGCCKSFCGHQVSSRPPSDRYSACLCFALMDCMPEQIGQQHLTPDGRLSKRSLHRPRHKSCFNEGVPFSPARPFLLYQVNPSCLFCAFWADNRFCGTDAV